ncbi:hypothetical protein GT037_001100 [Alternaria burnsii]|uniref:Hypersensitive response inducing protein 1 n=1 Tax=Alternaria burnsii TaxID=1187904 RepID=A0A8H7BEF0_9PLEO|nr:uncharacterized protein GT037_001100 [Alternaria burnsii]KAF7682124.1 hypothetical protein GT037_001100 [Alternaria burnsii]CAI9636076.1 unnamed protein product [Alternaria burnsii]
MYFSNILPVAFTAAAIAAPTTMNGRGEEGCVPTSYTISDYKLVTSPTSGSVDFTFKSVFPTGSTIDDPVQVGAHCSGSGTSVPNSNECQVANRRLLFDLRGPQDEAYYQITHSWTCSGNQWLSGNAIKVDSLECHNEGDKRVCTGEPQTFAPQNVRKVCNLPQC